jgi:alpha-glucosidase (family GH31 glycosyl hydrolase)
MKDSNEEEINKIISEDSEGEYKNVPIEHSKEIIDSLYNLNKFSKDKLLNYCLKISLALIVSIIFLSIGKKIIYDGIIEIILRNKMRKNFSILNNISNEEIERENGEVFYIQQNSSNINYESLVSPQFRNKNNIKLIEKLRITLSTEYEKFVHLKIKDFENKRWEIPEDVLNKDFLKNQAENRLSFSIYSDLMLSGDFYIEFLRRKSEEDDIEIEDDPNVDDNEDNNIIYDEEFVFRIMSYELKKEIFYFNSSENFLFSDTYINFQTRLTSRNIYGFGERTHDFLLNEGTYTIWSNDCRGTKYDDGLGGMNQYGHLPIGLHKTKYPNLWLGFVFLNTNAQDLVISYNSEKKNQTFLTHKTIGGIIDYYIIVDNSPENIVKDIQFLLGVPPLPPFWSLGNHQSRYGIKSLSQFEDIYNNYKKNEIPIDAMWIDIDAMDSYEIFTLNKEFENLGSFVKDSIHADGGKFVPIIDIGLSYENQASPMIKLGNSLNIFIKSNYTKEALIGKVWPGKTVFPDFFNPKIDQFWKKGLEDYHKLVEFDGIWLDMNEPANMVQDSVCLGEVIYDFKCTKDKNKYFDEDLPYFPGFRENITKNLSYWSISENALLYGNNTVYDAKPLISYYENKITYDYLENDLKVRPFILSRSTTLGSGKYSFHWLGDNFSNLDNLKNSISGLFNFNIFGIPFSGADICGFNDNSTTELCLRWYNLGAYYPFMRNHNNKNSIDQYPWSFNNSNGYDILFLIKKNINKRYSLLRYMYSQLFLISLNEKGSFFKPVMFEFPEENMSFENIESRVMFGEAFLICAFYDNNEDDKEFEMPKAHFNKYPRGRNIINFQDENRKIRLSGKLDTVHTFMRGGFIIPYQNSFDKFILNTKKLREEPLNLIINIDHMKQAKGVIFFDNEEIDTIKNQTYIRVNLFFFDKKLIVNTHKNKLENYNFNDHILNTIEIWRFDEIIKINKEQNEIKFQTEIIFLDNRKKEVRESIYEKDRNKIIFNISNGNDKISLFDIKEIYIK